MLFIIKFMYIAQRKAWSQSFSKKIWGFIENSISGDRTTETKLYANVIKDTAG